jgi:hypothetical protein
MDPNDENTGHRLWRGLHKPTLGVVFWTLIAALAVIAIAAGARVLALG